MNTTNRLPTSKKVIRMGEALDRAYCEGNLTDARQARTVAAYEGMIASYQARGLVRSAAAMQARIDLYVDAIAKGY